MEIREEHHVIGGPEMLNHHRSVAAVAIAPDNSFVVTASFDHTAKIWRLDEEHHVIGEPEILNHDGEVNKVVVASDSSFVVTASSDDTAKIWKLDEEHHVIGEPEILNHEADSLIVASNNSFVVTGSFFGHAIKIWRLGEDRKVIGGPTILTLESDPLLIAHDNSFVLTRYAPGIGIHKGIKDLQNLTTSQLLFIFKLVGQADGVIDLRRESKALEVIYESFPEKLKQRLSGHIIERSLWDKIKRPCLCAALVGGASYLAYKLLKK